MPRVPNDTVRGFDAAIEAAGVVKEERWHYQKWLRYYLDFCGKYSHRADEESSLPPFIEKLTSKKQTESQRRQASRAVQLYLGMQGQTGMAARSGKEKPLFSRKEKTCDPSPGAGSGVPRGSSSKPAGQIRKEARQNRRESPLLEVE